MAVATNTTLGEIQLAGDLAGNNNGLAPELTPTSVTPGSYIVSNFTVDAKGRITEASNASSSDILSLVPDATISTKGKVQIGDGISVTNGVISVPLASSSVRGRVRVATGSGLAINSGVLSFDPSSLPLATTSTPGVVRINPTGGITVSSGVISATAPPLATNAVAGLVQAGSYIDVTSGTFSLRKASETDFGVIKVNGTGLSIVDGVLTLNPAAYQATSTTPGFVKIGANLNVAPNGDVSLNFGFASPSQFGVIKVGSGLAIDGNGVLSNTLATSPPIASTSQLGLVQIGTNINVTGGGLISIPTATTTVAGVLRVGTLGIEVDPSGTINARVATNTQLGVVSTADPNNINISAGLLSVGPNIPKKNEVNVFTKAQVTQLVDRGNVSGTVTLDLSDGNVQRMRLTGNTTLANPTNVTAGGVYHIIVEQDGTGNRTLAFGTNFKFDGYFGASYDLRANRITVITALALSSTVLLCQTAEGF